MFIRINDNVPLTKLCVEYILARADGITLYETLFNMRQRIEGRIGHENADKHIR